MLKITVFESNHLFAETMLQVQQKQSATLPEQLEQRIAYTNAAINEKVYALYGLSKEEVAVIENKN